MIQKIAVIGDRISVLGFQALGMEVFSPNNPEDTRQKIFDLIKQDYGVILITEGCALPVIEAIEKYRKRITPSILIIPDRFGSKETGIDAINTGVERAIGRNLF